MALPPKTPEPLNFEPLSSGLGFHPFTDGLPYAPVSKAGTSNQSNATNTTANAGNAAPLNMGTGAMAAGAPSYAPRIPVATRAPTSPRAPTTTHRAPVASSNTTAHQKSAVQKSAAAAAAANTNLAVEQLTAGLTPELLQPTFGFGYLFKRVFAYLIDSLFNLGLCAAALSAALWKQDLSPELLLNPGIVIVAALFLAFFNWAITTAEEVAFGTSIGKRLFGLAIQGSASAIFLRSFFFLPSICFGGIGMLWAIFDRRRRCWHDLVVDLQPIEIARL